jgi:transcriptional regulator with XRE-family HTH domain
MDTDTFRTVIAGHVRAEMARQCKTQRDLAEVLGIDEGSTSLRFRGARSFRAEELVQVADWLGVPIGQLVPVGAVERAS